MKRKFEVSNGVDLSNMKSSQLDGFFIGCVLGDGCIRTYGSFNFCNTKKPLVDLVEKAIKDSTEFKTGRRFAKGKFRRGYQESDMFSVEVHGQREYFNKLRKLLYADDRRRIISDKALSKLNIHSLAIWYMSDGCRAAYGRKNGEVFKRKISLSTHAFSYEDNKKIALWFEHNLGIKPTINKQGKYWFINFPLKEAQKFIALIFPYMIPEFYYKIDLLYPDGDKRMTPEYLEIYDKITEYRSDADKALDMR